MNIFQKSGTGQPPRFGQQSGKQLGRDDFNIRTAKLSAVADKSQTVEESKALLRDYPREPMAHFILSRALTEANKKNEALPFAEAAYKLDSENAQYALYLGMLYEEFKLDEFALPLLRKAVKLAPHIYLMHASLGDVYEGINQGERSIECYREAIRLCRDETMKERLHSKASSALIHAAKFDEAKVHIDKLLTCSGFAYAAGVRDAANISKDGVASAEGVRLLELISQQDDDADKRADLLLTYGRMHERDKNYDAAFQCWIDARAIKLKGKPSLRDHDGDFKNFREFYSPELKKIAEPHGHPSEEPVFIVGMPRTGTTLTEQILGSHPDAAGVGELARFGQLDRAFRADYPAERRLVKLRKRAEAGELKARAAETLRIFDVVADRPRLRTVEKTPHNFLFVGYLRTMFPRAKFIHIRRHPLDAFISAYQNNLNKSHAYSYTQESYLLEYLAQDRIMRYWKKLYPGQIMTMHYEDLTQDNEHWARQMVDFIGLPWSDECLKFHEKAKTVRTISFAQVRAPVHTASVERWRRYETHLGPIIGLMEKFGFEYRRPADVSGVNHLAPFRTDAT